MGRKTKVAFINYSLGLGGIETLILEISKKLDKKLFEPSVFIFEKDGKLYYKFEVNRVSQLRSSILQNQISEVVKFKV